MRYFEKHKREFFPEITDWSDPQNQYRYYRPILSQKYKYFFFFSPYNYKLVTFGIQSVNIIIWGLAAYAAWHMGLRIISAVAILLVLYSIFKLVKLIRNYHLMGDINFYDLWMREEE